MFVFFLGEGEVFSWGLGYGGKLGQGHLRDRSTPLRVAALKDMKITTIACHEFHTAAVCGKIMTRLAQSNFFLIVENCPDLR